MRVAVIFALLVVMSNMFPLSASSRFIRKQQSCKRVGDIVILADESSSIGTKNFRLMKNFFSDLVSRFNISRFGAHFGVVTFASRAKVDIQLNRYHRRSALQNAIQNLEYRGGDSYTGRAFELVQNSVYGTKGDRKYAPNVLVLVNDGPSRDQAKALRSARLLKKSGVEIICVAIETGRRTSARLIYQLRQLASKPQWVFKTGFNAIKTIENKLVKNVCTAADPCNSKPCLNKGKCSAHRHTFKCSCPSGYTGKRCGKRVMITYKDPCGKQPCLHGGTCISNRLRKTYTCQCKSGFFGKNCRFVKDSCASKPCKNGGKCTTGKVVDRKSGRRTHTCKCPARYDGANCQNRLQYIKKGCRYVKGVTDHILFNWRSRFNKHIWTAGWNNFITKAVRRCYRRAKAQNYNFFYIEFYAECHAVRSLNYRKLPLQPNKCWGKRPNYNPCSWNKKRPICVGDGNGHHGYVYQIV